MTGGRLWDDDDGGGDADPARGICSWCSGSDGTITRARTAPVPFRGKGWSSTSRGSETAALAGGGDARFRRREDEDMQIAGAYIS